MAVKHTSAMRPRIFALPAPSPSPRRQPQPHKLSGSASSPFRGPPRLPIGPHHPPHTWHPPPRFLIRSHPSPILGLFVPPPSPLCGLGSRIPPVTRDSNVPHRYILPRFRKRETPSPHPHHRASARSPSSALLFPPPPIGLHASLSYVASTSVAIHWLAPFLISPGALVPPPRLFAGSVPEQPCPEGLECTSPVHVGLPFPGFPVIDAVPTSARCLYEPTLPLTGPHLPMWRGVHLLHLALARTPL